MKKGQWFISTGIWGLIGTFLGAFLGPPLLGLPLDFAIVFEKMAPVFSAGVILILIGLIIKIHAKKHSAAAAPSGAWNHPLDSNNPQDFKDGSNDAPSTQPAKPNRAAIYALAGACFLLLIAVTVLWLENGALYRDKNNLNGQVDELCEVCFMLEDEISTLTSQNADLQDLASALKDRLRVVQGEADRSRAELYALRYGPQ